MWTAALWGLVQGLTEFLPISSSGHLVLVPALLDMEAPSLATTAVLHLGTMAAVVWYLRSDLMWLTRFRTDPRAAHMVKMLAIATIPALIAGGLLEWWLSDIGDDPGLVAVFLFCTGVVLTAAEVMRRARKPDRQLASTTGTDAVAIGVGQALALVPGVSRSGMTIAFGLDRRFEPSEAARFAFLMAVPIIAISGAVQAIELFNEGGITWSLWVGVAVAAVSGYAAIALLLRLINRVGLWPFAAYCMAAGVWSTLVL